MPKTDFNASKLNDLQISLLRLFDREMTEEQILSLKQVLVQHYDKLLKAELEKVIAEKGYTQADFDAMLLDES
jgi:hypothetical protein